MLEDTGVFDYALKLCQQTMVAFRAHFHRENEERARLLTKQSAGYHSANLAVPPMPPPTPAQVCEPVLPPAVALAVIPPPRTTTPAAHTPAVFVDGDTN